MRKVTTRLMQIDTDDYAVYRSETTASSRVGTKNLYIAHGTVTGQLTPKTDEKSLQEYGNRVHEMYDLIVQKGADIQLNDKVLISGSYYSVNAAVEYQGHINCTIERVSAL